MSTLEGKVVAKTGAARGMGRAFTEAFLDQGAKVVAMDISWEPSGFSGDRDDAFMRRLAEETGDVIVATVDVTDNSQINDA